MSYKDDVEDLGFDEEDDSKKEKKNNRSNRKERRVFSVYEIDTKGNNTPAYCCFESFGNPIPCLRYAARMNSKNGRHRYAVSPRPSQAMMTAANV